LTVRADGVKKGRLSERTLVSYDEIWRLYLEPELGRRPLNTITRENVGDVLATAPSPVRERDVHKVLRMILGRAVKAGKIATNPASGVELPEIEHREPWTLTADELERLVDVMPDRYRAFVIVAVYSALRWSELVALRVARLDLIRNRIRVEEKITESGRLIAGTPKTERSRRAVTIPEFVTFELAEHLRRYPTDDLVFTAAKGGPIRRRRSTVSSGRRRSRLQVCRGSRSDTCDTRARR
jgi:integrase